MDTASIAARLAALGWLEDPDVTQREVDDAVHEYQDWWKLKPDGIVGPKTTASLDAVRFCACPDRMKQTDCKWSNTHITWRIAGRLPTMTAEQIAVQFNAAMNDWQAVGKITHERVETGGDIVVATGDIDGASGTLAWSQLPCGPDRQLSQKYDGGENWWRSFPAPSGRISFRAVASHEIGHALGLEHSPEPGALMAPTYNPSIGSPQPIFDIPEIQRRYGKPSGGNGNGSLVLLSVDSDGATVRDGQQQLVIPWN